MLGKSIPDLIDKKLIDLRQLIKDAIPKAVSLKQSARVKRRLEILVGEIETLNFYEILAEALVRKIRSDQEQTYQPERWLVKMSIRSLYLSEGCTFAKSVWLHLVNSIAAEALADIINRIDAHGELEHALKKASWQQKFFFILVKSGEWSETGGIQEVKELTVKFPFSWLLLLRIERLQEANLHDNILEAFNENDFCVAANELMMDSSEVVSAFVSDILAIKIPDAMKTGLLKDLLIKKLVFLARNFYLERINNELGTWQGITAIDVYRAFTSIGDRVKHAVEIVGICKSDIVQKVCQEDGDDFDLDNVAMCCAIDQLKPCKAQDFDYEEWKQIVVRLTSVMTSMTNPSTLLQDKWNKLLIVKYFLEYVWTDDATKEVIFLKVALLWTLKNIEFVDSSKTFDSILKIIKKCSTQAAEKILRLKNADNCLICLNVFKDPILLPCRHVCCKECFEQTVGPSGLQCPAGRAICKEPFPKDFKLESSTECVQGIEKHSEFRKG